MDDIQELLYSSVSDTLSTVGESTLQAFVMHLNQEGIQMTPVHVDIKGIESELREFFGDAADVIIENMYDDFMKKAKERGFANSDLSAEANESLSVADAMRRFLEKSTTDTNRD